MPESAEVESNPRSEFLMHVGLCITSWAEVEEQLYRLCLKTLGTTEQRAAIVYYRTPTLDSRLKLVDELIRSTFPEPRRKSGDHPHANAKAWDQLRNKIENQFKIRRRVAHHPVAPRHAIQMKVTKEKYGKIIKSLKIESLGLISWLEIYASESELARKRDVDLEPLKIADLKAHHERVHELASQLEHFLLDKLEVLPK